LVLCKSPNRLFDKFGEQIVNDVFDGYNVTVMAVGASGTGKSHTLFGYDDDDAGLAPRIVQQLFDKIAEEVSDDATHYVEASLLEIHNEKVGDLLSANDFRAAHTVREHPHMGAYAEGVSHSLLSDIDECKQLLNEGFAARSLLVTGR
jgi:hypothetical protein